MKGLRLTSSRADQHMQGKWAEVGRLRWRAESVVLREFRQSMQKTLADNETPNQANHVTGSSSV